jgi:hypothetical protein
MGKRRDYTEIKMAAGASEDEVTASIQAALRAEVLRLMGKPLEKCSREELDAALPDGLDVESDIDSGDDGDDYHLIRTICSVGLELGIPMADPTVELSEPFGPGGHPSMQFEFTRQNLYVLLDGKRIARRGDPDTPQAKTWVSMIPGCMVRDLDEDTIEVWKDGRQLQ